MKSPIKQPTTKQSTFDQCNQYNIIYTHTYVIYVLKHITCVQCSNMWLSTNVCYNGIKLQICMYCALKVFFDILLVLLICLTWVPQYNELKSVVKNSI